MIFEVSYPEVIAPRRPPGHQPAAPRYSLRWQKPISGLVSVYFGIQAKTLCWSSESAFYQLILEKLAAEGGTSIREIMRCNDDAGYINGIVVGYWTDPTAYSRWIETSGFRDWFASKARLQGDAGYWCEVISVPYDRHETIYSASGYRVGFGRTADSVVVPITTNGYFGAARDRLPISSIDALESPYGSTLPSAHLTNTSGRHLVAMVPYNAVFLRSGQFWEGAGQEQLEDYRHALQPKLHRGMQYLSDHPEQTGCMSLRIMTNLNADGSPRAETSVSALLLSMTHLEGWAASHETHLDIYRHAIAMNRLHQEKREVVTWHELCVMNHGNMFEYINCHPRTGLLPWARLCEPVMGN